jgi:hypothetical protein
LEIASFLYIPKFFFSFCSHMFDCLELTFAIESASITRACVRCKIIKHEQICSVVKVRGKK